VRLHTRLQGRTLLAACSALSVALLVFPVAHAGTETTTVTIDADGLTPAQAMVSLGDAVRWANEDSRTHRVASPEGFFRTSWISPSETSERVVAISAGSFGYATTGLARDGEGVVRIPVRIRPGPRSTPTPGAKITIVMATERRPQRIYDVQRRLDDGEWVTMARDTPRPQVVFRPQRTGLFWFRARVELSGGGTSLWSPPRKKHVAPPP
jgi:plastocyanin